MKLPVQVKGCERNAFGTCCIFNFLSHVLMGLPGTDSDLLETVLGVAPSLSHLLSPSLPSALLHFSKAQQVCTQHQVWKEAQVNTSPPPTPRQDLM